MHYKFSDTDIKKLLKENFMILYDTREQQNSHILAYFDSKKISYKRKKIDEGDYTAIITKRHDMGIYRDLYFPVAVERKNSVDELAGNLSEKTDTHDDIRLIRELQRAKSKGVKLYMMIEDKNAMDHIKAGEYRSQYRPTAFYGRLRSIQTQYLYGMEFINKIDAGNTIYGILKYSVRNFLKELDADISPENEKVVE
ncbi:ERCC4 domain-containing protein [Clostridium tyrobutyricum]|uniref:ERCC4 domain-containing protein n=1 Tax=Clostridium tyrobutyricum TaxID=1519 RepID=UPI0030D2669F